MIEFVRVPASKFSLARRRPVLGVGINDANYMTKNNGQRCPFYQVWVSMIHRCYNSNIHAARPTYIGCSVAKEWHSFTAFRLWMVLQDWQGKQLDKDILVQGNKVYSSENCVFVTRAVNILLSDSAASRGSCPIGVHLDNRSGRYKAQCRNGDRQVVLGLFDTPDDASTAYNAFKMERIRSVALEQVEPLKSALLRYKIGLN